jgi:hypothetical protein
MLAARKYLLICAILLIQLALFLGACSSTRSAATQVDDAAITAAIKAKLAADGDINPFNIDVDTNNGVVTLRGRVEKREARDKAAQLASGTEGVREVINLLKVGDTGGGGDPCYSPECPCLDGTCSESCCRG